MGGYPWPASSSVMSTRMAFLAVAAHVQVTTGVLPYALDESYVGEDFFDKFDFYTGLDPSSGSVDYVGRGEAFEQQLVKATGERVYVGADKSSVVEGTRRSVRIQSVATYNQGLFIARIDHVPTGCGTWPAFWMYGEDPEHVWPEKGEYDIIESVHGATRTLTTLHTDANCDQSYVSAEGGSMMWDKGTAGAPADNCDVAATDQFKNQGCSQLGPPGSAGASFNAGNGGTYAAEWDPEAMHIRTWFWPSGEEPPDLATRRPDPDAWGAPYSRFSLSPMTCPAGHFSDMRLVLNVNFCGDLGSSKFSEMCPEYAATMTCEEFIAQHPERMTQAFWSIRVLDVYQRKVSSPQSPFVVMGDAPNGVNPVAPTQLSSPAEEILSKHPWLIGVGITGGLLIIGVLASLVVANMWRKMHRGGMMTPPSPLMLPSRGPPPAQSPLVSMRDPDGASTARDRLESWGGNTARDRVDSWGSSTRDRLDSWQSVGRSRAGSWNGGPDRPSWTPGPGFFDP